MASLPGSLWKGKAKQAGKYRLQAGVTRPQGIDLPAFLQVLPFGTGRDRFTEGRRIEFLQQIRQRCLRGPFGIEQGFAGA